MSANVRKRLDHLDLAKAITIFLVMIGHAAGNGERPFYRMVLYTFHMPLFFMVSGTVIRRHRTSGYGWEHWKLFLRRNILALVMPYFLWALIYSVFSYQNVLRILYGSWQTLTDAETLTSLWFLPCLFTARILMELVLMSYGLFKRTERHLYAFFASVVSFAVAYLLPVVKQGYPWCLNCAFGAMGFMLLGYALKDVIDRLVQKGISFWIGAFLLCLALLVTGIAVQKGNVYYVKMFTGDYGSPLLFFPNALSGCGAVISLSVLTAKYCEKHPESRVRAGLLWIGRNTLGIYLLHKPLLQQVFLPLLGRIGFTKPDVLAAVCGAAITLPVCCLLIRLIDRYIPQLFGKFPSPERIVLRKSDTVEGEEPLTE